jgi:hypothetical protein
MHRTIRLLLSAMLLMLLLQPAHAADNRLYLVSQYNFGAKTGFYLGFENATNGANRVPLSTVRLILAVGDGTNWRFLSRQPAFETGRDYVVTGTIAPQKARLELDGKTLQEESCRLKGDESPLLINDSPGWARAPAEYLIAMKSLRITRDGKPSVTLDLSSGQPLPVRLFGGLDTRRNETWRPVKGETLRIEVTLRIDRRPEDLHASAPFLDRFGQSRHAEWSGKVRSDTDLKRAAREEEALRKTMPPPADYDAYGGYKRAGWRGVANGFYTAIQRDGRWWLLSPQGNPTFYTGVDTAPALAWDTTPVTGREFLFAELPPRTGPTASAWSENPWGADPGIATVAFHSANMARKYGPDWQQAEKRLTAQRLRSWGFSGLGKFCDILPGVPSIPVLNYSGIPKLARHPDIFDPAVQNAFQEALRKQIAPHTNDATIVGWSIGNEYDEIITPEEIQEILKRPGTVPAKRALIDYAVDMLSGGDVSKAAQAGGVSATDRAALYTAMPVFSKETVESLRRFYADRYYAYLYKTVKDLDPHHLYFGFWISYGWWVNEEDWRLIGRHCDVIGYDRYAYAFSEPNFDRLMQETNKPIYCGEFSFPPGYHGERGYGFYNSSVEDEAMAGKYYARWIQEAASNPYCIGTGWFQYRDEPLTGRGPGHGTALVYGEDFAFGIVDVTDRPKWTLVKAMRDANLTAVKRRLAASSAQARH